MCLLPLDCNIKAAESFVLRHHKTQTFCIEWWGRFTALCWELEQVWTRDKHDTRRHSLRERKARKTQSSILEKKSQGASILLICALKENVDSLHSQLLEIKFLNHIGDTAIERPRCLIFYPYRQWHESFKWDSFCRLRPFFRLMNPKQTFICVISEPAWMGPESRQDI